LNRIEVGDIFVDKDYYRDGRTLTVLAVFMPETYKLREGYVACSYRGGKVTVVSYDRLSNPVRFEKVDRRAPGVMGELAGDRTGDELF
jgi:hypothetical protein